MCVGICVCSFLEEIVASFHSDKKNTMHESKRYIDIFIVTMLIANYDILVCLFRYLVMRTII